MQETMKVSYDLYVITTDGTVALAHQFPGTDIEEAFAAFEKVKEGKMVRAIFLDQAQRVGKSTTKVNVLKWRRRRADQTNGQGCGVRPAAQG